MFQTIEPEGTNSAQEEEEWESIDMAVDSGAIETVLGENDVASVEVKEGLAYKRGVKYEVANGTVIPNLGEKKFQGVTEEGVANSLTAQVCDVNKALLSVRKMTKAGNKVVFDDGASYIENKASGQKIWMREENGMYILKVWVKRAPF